MKKLKKAKVRKRKRKVFKIIIGIKTMISISKDGREIRYLSWFGVLSDLISAPVRDTKEALRKYYENLEVLSNSGAIMPKVSSHEPHYHGKISGIENGEIHSHFRYHPATLVGSPGYLEIECALVYPKDAPKWIIDRITASIINHQVLDRRNRLLDRRLNSDYGGPERRSPERRKCPYKPVFLN